MPRRRSLSASRTLDSTVNFVGRIGASLRISSKRRGVKQQHSTQDASSVNLSAASSGPSSPWLRFTARVDRSLSACSNGTAFRNFGNNLSTDESFAFDLDSEIEVGSVKRGALVHAHSYAGTESDGVNSSCPSTPKMRRKYIKEGATQLTSLNTLLTHHRYLFLFNDLLLISKQKGENSYKLKEKINLERLWVSSNSGTHSFLIGWPISNYVAHFSCEEEKNEWFRTLEECIKKKQSAKSTTVSVSVRVEGRQQNIRKEVKNGVRASELVAELIEDLDLPGDFHHYELGFETGANGVQTLHGIELLYAVLVDYAMKSGLSSEAHLAHLDTCPLVHCRLVLRHMSSPRPSTALNIVSQFKRVLSRSESKRLFGRELEGSMPPQPVLTMIDYLMDHGADVEGILRKSPKQATVRILKTQLDQGQVPDFHQFNIHVTASLIKEYLRSIPGQLLLSGNYHLWMEVVDEQDTEKKKKMCKNLLKLLPAAHIILLRSILKLLRRISMDGNSKMSVKSLAVCIAPSLLENPMSDIVDSARKVPELAMYLIEHAPELLDGFDDGILPLVSSDNKPQLHQSTESGLSCSSSIENNEHVNGSISPDSALFESPMSDSSAGEIDEDKHVFNNGLKIEEIKLDPLNISMTSAEFKNSLEPCSDDLDRTPVLSRENSDVKTQFPNRYQWKSHLSRPDASPILYASPKPASERKLARQDAFRAAVSAQSSVSSQDQSLDEQDVRFLRLSQYADSRASSMVGSPEPPADPNPSTSRNYVNKVEDLRVADIIISHKKKDSTDSTKTLIGSRNDSSGHPYFYSSISAKSSDYSGKFSTLSSLDENTSVKTQNSNLSPNVSPFSSESGISVASKMTSSSLSPESIPIIVPSAKPLPKRPLLTKSDTLGITSGPPLPRSRLEVPTVHRNARFSSVVLNHGSLDRNFSMDPSPTGNNTVLSNTILSPRSPLVERKNFEPIQTRPSSARTAPVMMETSWAFKQASTSDETEKHLPARLDSLRYNLLDRSTGSLDRSINSSTSSLYATITKNPSVPDWKSRTAGNDESVRNFGNSPHSEVRTAELVHLVSQQARRSSGTPSEYNSLERKPIRKPQRAPEELDIYWSVPHLRSVFSQKDSKPVSIDTVYAKLDSFQRPQKQIAP